MGRVGLRGGWPLWLGVVLFAPAARAQSGSLLVPAAPAPPPGYAEYVALLQTPVSGLPPLLTYTLVGLAQQSPQFAVRYGYVPDVARPLAGDSGGHEKRSLDSFGATAVLPAGLGSTLALTAGVANERCSGCRAHLTLGIGGDVRLAATAFGNAADALRLGVGVNGEAGFGMAEQGSIWAGHVGVPITLMVGGASGGTRVVPFLTPGVAYVSASEGTAERGPAHGSRFTGAGGVGLFNAKSSLSASVGFQYVFVRDADLQVGLALSIGGR
ncbi:MAG TPA: hypothetical protein VJU87_00370 [Gemmatimonadaceae bacterium]|nr:hypothetical protein [Gemmatimonadaceae bacterium]